MFDKNQPKTRRQAAFLKRLEKAKRRLLAAIDGLDNATLCGQPVTGIWTIKDILGHVIAWNEEFRGNIAMIVAGEHPGFDHRIGGENDFYASNQQWFEAKQDQPLDIILADLERDYQEACILILKLTSREYQMRGVTPWKEAAKTKPTRLTQEDTDSVETLVTFHWRHMNQHAKAIEEWRKRNE